MPASRPISIALVGTIAALLPACSRGGGMPDSGESDVPPGCFVCDLSTMSCAPGEVYCPRSGPIVCAGQLCASGTECCFVTGLCFDPVASPSDCPRPSAVPPGVEATPCGANSQCASNQFCTSPGTHECLGPGYCLDRYNCGSGGQTPCGCDGTNYANIQSACVSGVRVASDRSACGIGTIVDGGPESDGAPQPDANPVEVIACGFDSQCPIGYLCCFSSGSCYEPSCDTCCASVSGDP